MGYKIALVEDDHLIQQMMKINLESNGHQLFCFNRGEELLASLAAETFDVVVLDLMLPGISGLDTLKKLREDQLNTPVLVLTVRKELYNKLSAFDLGADDYLVKPFNMDELIARVSALLRRCQGQRTIPSSEILTINNYRINLATRECESSGGPIVLSEKEIKLLLYFAANCGITLKRADILEEVWGMDVSPTPRTIDNFIVKFRKLFEIDPNNPKHFISVRSRGYRFEQ
jgi:two-component system alkaline phosphatase synthesis response regulator PhoP